MATVPSPTPDYAPGESPEPMSPPTELPPMPGDIDRPAPMTEPTPDSSQMQA